jgi:chromosomal replication initiation ATPase DnaA
MASGSHSWVLLERDREKAAIADVLGGAQAARGGTLLFRGGAGAGKTALLQAACRAAGARKMVVLTGRGADFERDFPFGVARQLLDRKSVV